MESVSKKKRMLIVDDERNMRHMLTSMLKKFGYNVDTAADGTDALKMVNQNTYDVVLCDLKMPNMDGMAFLEAARDMLSETTELRDRLEENTRRFREEMIRIGFEINPGIHPIVPIMLHDERLAHEMAEAMLDKGIYVIGFSYPVVPRGQARIRVQLSALHQRAHLDKALDAFQETGRSLGVIS